MSHYLLWRYILIFSLFTVGMIYALPNIYGQDPAIQVSTQNFCLPDRTTEKIRAALNHQKITYLAIKKQSPHDLLISFHDTQSQLKAQNIIQLLLGSNFFVVLNLSPKTPAWLSSIAAKPMKLGLDLFGGIHFLLKVDIASMLKERLSSDVLSFEEALRTAKVHYAGIRKNNRNIQITFRNKLDQVEAFNQLKKHFLNYNYFFSQKNQKFVILVSWKNKNFIKLKQYAMEQNLMTLRNRVNALGIAEPIVQQQGSDEISVNLPGIQDTARAKNIIGKVATIRMQLQDIDHDAAMAQKTHIIPLGSTLYTQKGYPILLKNQVVLSGSSISGAKPSVDEEGRPAVSIHLNGSGVRSFSKITAANIGKTLAVVYVETKKNKEIMKVKKAKVITKLHQVERVINVATIQSALGNNFQITGLRSMLEAKNLALLLRSGAYTAPVTFVQEQVVGPSLGKQNIQQGIFSCVIGSLLVIIFMFVYYGLFGLVANLALAMNVVFIIAIMSILGATLTLPGIAGIVLTVGMAVDANVLINERIREEFRLGMTPQAAIYSGYDRAFSTIVDANVTTLIVACVLYGLGIGSIRGFAVTLIIGLSTSMITSVFFTRSVINLFYNHRTLKRSFIGIRMKI